MAKILVIEDEENLRFAIRKGLTKAGHDVEESPDADTALGVIRETSPDAIVTDVSLPSSMSGIDLLSQIRSDGFEGVVIVITAYASIEKAVLAMREGADDYIQKPLRLDELNVALERALELRALRRKLHLLERLDGVAESTRNELVGESDAWRSALDMANRLARMPLPTQDHLAQGVPVPSILLLGETGTGKGSLARYIHDIACEHDADTPFVHVNCSALPPSLIESELFGHEKGAFTDAKAARTGLFELAEGGTVFLDEIGDMPLELQSRLLLVVERGAYRRIGGSSERRVRARIIAATNQDLDANVRDGSFRQDLLYRLNAFTITLPPLRERNGDIQLIARSCLEQICTRHRRTDMTFAPDTLDALEAHDWPGNIRELINCLQRAVMLADSNEITPANLGLPSRPHRSNQSPSSGAHADDQPLPQTNGRLHFDFKNKQYTADDVEKELIRQALAEVGGNISKAARLIGMNRSSLRYRIERSGLEEYIKEITKR